MRKKEFLSITVVSLLFFWFLSICAGLTMLTHLAQAAGFSFQAYARTALIAIICFSILYYLIIRKQVKQIKVRDIKTLLVVFLIGLLGSAIALFIHRPDKDDFFYVPNAVYYVQHPHSPMGDEIHFIYSGGAPFRSTFWGAPNAYEYIQGVPAYVGGMPYLRVYYIFSVGLVGFMIPLALFLVISHFSEDTFSAALGAFICIAVLLTLGETHRTFGNFAFPRVFQGKVFLLSVGIPLFVAFSIDYFKKRTVFAWAGLFAASTALAGSSTSSFVLLPALGIILFISNFFTMERKVIKSIIPLFISYFCSLSYVLFLAARVLLKENRFTRIVDIVNAAYPTSFGEYLRFFIDPKWPITPLLLALATSLAIFFFRENRVFLGSWILTLLILFLNPLFLKLAVGHLRGTYWRLFYLYPFPLVAGIAAASVLPKIKLLKPARQFFLRSMLLAAPWALAIFSPSSVFQQPYVEIHWPGYKLQKPLQDAAQKITAISVGGPMLAPWPLAGMIPLFDSNFPQMALTKEGVHFWLYGQNRGSEAELRLQAADYIAGQGGDLLSLESLIKMYPEIRSVVITTSVFQNNLSLRDFFKNNRFLHQETISNYLLLWR